VLVFDGCYHGTVDDTMLDTIDGKVVNRQSLLGQVQDLTQHSTLVPFNDLTAVENALKSNEFAALLTEPALTNCGMVLPAEGFIQGLRALCTKYNTLLILDETHTISTAHGGWAKANNVVPDFLVVGKPIAGGLPAAAYGFSAQMAQKMQAAKDAAVPGHSGIGTTLSGNMMTLAAIHATLTKTATVEAYARMLNLAISLEKQLIASIEAHNLLWNISRMGARLELQFCEKSPTNAAEARAAQNDTNESAIHLFLLNRGVLLTPFHNMMLVCPATTQADVQKLVQIFNDCLKELTAC
jgi:glutamate-1-semialdehyde 2,1-aminomutase